MVISTWSTYKYSVPGICTLLFQVDPMLDSQLGYQQNLLGNAVNARISAQLQISAPPPPPRK